MELVTNAVGQITLDTPQPSESHGADDVITPSPPSRKDFSEYTMETQLVR